VEERERKKRRKRECERKKERDFVEQRLEGFLYCKNLCICICIHICIYMACKGEREKTARERKRERG